jgi:hypothetical protein
MHHIVPVEWIAPGDISGGEESTAAPGPTARLSRDRATQKRKLPRATQQQPLFLFVGGRAVTILRVVGILSCVNIVPVTIQEHDNLSTMPVSEHGDSSRTAVDIEDEDHIDYSEIEAK